LLRDPNIGAQKLICGTDSDASVPKVVVPGGYPTTYRIKATGPRIPAHQVYFFGWSLRQIAKLNITRDDVNLIPGGNVVRAFKLEDKGPHNRIFKAYMK
jgi:hypothetical protein